MRAYFSDVMAVAAGIRVVKLVVIICIALIVREGTACPDIFVGSIIVVRRRHGLRKRSSECAA